ncbi:hypothetical protein VYU27_010301, partial [Nannochloropsis oceanica]
AHGNAALPDGGLVSIHLSCAGFVAEAKGGTPLPPSSLLSPPPASTARRKKGAKGGREGEGGGEGGWGEKYVVGLDDAEEGLSFEAGQWRLRPLDPSLPLLSPIDVLPPKPFEVTVHVDEIPNSSAVDSPPTFTIALLPGRPHALRLLLPPSTIGDDEKGEGREEEEEEEDEEEQEENGNKAGEEKEEEEEEEEEEAADENGEGRKSDGRKKRGRGRNGGRTIEANHNKQKKKHKKNEREVEEGGEGGGRQGGREGGREGAKYQGRGGRGIVVENEHLLPTLNVAVVDAQGNVTAPESREKKWSITATGECLLSTSSSSSSSLTWTVDSQGQCAVGGIIVRREGGREEGEGGKGGRGRRRKIGVEVPWGGDENEDDSPSSSPSSPPSPPFNEVSSSLLLTLGGVEDEDEDEGEGGREGGGRKGIVLKVPLVVTPSTRPRRLVLYQISVSSPTSTMFISLPPS